MVPAPAPDYSQCVDDVLNGTVEAMSTDGAILLGYAAQNEGELKVVGEEFSEERIGVGYSHRPPRDVRVDQRRAPGLVRRRHLGRGFRGHARRGGAETPEPPALDECRRLTSGRLSWGWPQRPPPSTTPDRT